MAEGNESSKKPDPYRSYMSPDMGLHMVFLCVAVFGVMATVASRFVREWPFALQLAALALALTILVTLICRSRRR